MKREEYKVMFEQEGKHWWFLGKRYLIKTLMERIDKKNKILDIGCGTGIIMKDLERYGEVHGIDYSNEAIRFCKVRKLKDVKKGSVMRIPYKASMFDVVTCFDVLYHKNVDDERAIKEIKKVLKKKGHLVLTDSAFKFLMGRHDRATEARTRYSKKELRLKLEKHGFNVKEISYYNFFLFPLVFILRKLDNVINKDKEAKSDIQNTNFIANFLFFNLLKLEANILKQFNFPFGVSIYCIAQKE